LLALVEHRGRGGEPGVGGGLFAPLAQRDREGDVGRAESDARAVVYRRGVRGPGGGHRGPFERGGRGGRRPWSAGRGGAAVGGSDAVQGGVGGQCDAAAPCDVADREVVVLGGEVGHRVGDEERLDVAHEGVGGGEQAADVGVDPGDEQLVAAHGGEALLQVGLGEGAVAPLGEEG